MDQWLANMRAAFADTKSCQTFDGREQQLQQAQARGDRLEGALKEAYGVVASFLLEMGRHETSEAVSERLGGAECMVWQQET